MREIPDPARHDGSLFGLELRIERAGELHLSEVFKDRKRLEARSTELRSMLIEKGWKLERTS